MSDQVTNLMYDGVVELPAAGPQYANDASAKNIPGMVIRRNGKLYRYVQFDDGVSVPPVAGGAVYWKTLTPASGIFIVTSDASAGISICLVAGIIGTVVTDQYYTWIQIGGPATCIVESGTIAGDRMEGAWDNILGRVPTGGTSAHNIIGVALDARESTNGTATVLLQNLFW